MFESTKWILKDSECTPVNKYDSVAPIVAKPPENTNSTKNVNEITEIGIIQQYQFSSSLQRMSVIVHASGSDDFRAYTKGSPEMIINLSKAETVPKDISLILERFTRQGFRVIAMGRRAIASRSGTAEVIPEQFLVTFSFPCAIQSKHDSKRYLPKSTCVFADIEIVSRNDRTGLGILGTDHFGKSIEATDGISDYGTKRSQYTRDDDYRFALKQCNTRTISSPRASIRQVTLLRVILWTRLLIFRR